MNNTILYIGGFILPDGNAAAQRVMANSALLKEFGFEVVFLGTNKKETEKEKGVISSLKVVNGYKSFITNYPNSFAEWINYETSIDNTKTLIHHIGEKNIRAIIAYNFPSVALRRLNTFCRKKNIAILSDCTEWPNGDSPNFLRSIIMKLDTYYRMKIVHQQLSGLIAISSFLYDYYNPRMKNVLQLPPLVDISEKKWGLENYKPSHICQLVYAGSPGKGSKDRIDKIIKALSSVKLKTDRPFHLTIVGITKSQYVDAFGNDSIPENIDTNITFKGRVPHLESIRIAKCSDYSIFIRDNTRLTMAGFPTKFVESISCGTPVLTNDTSNINDYLKNGELGYLLDISSEEALVESMVIAISKPPEIIAKMKANCNNSHLFDYRKYKNDFQIFLQQIGLV